jgi:Tol biopolymer transport system component
MADSVDPKLVDDQLARILASDGFRNSPRLSRFLQHIVAASADPSKGSLKEYSIGIDVFDKPPSFDPRHDSTVRGEAAKLRQKLRQYYDTTGRDDALRIEIPKGAYSTIFLPHRRANGNRTRLYASFAAVVAVALPAWWLNRPAPALADLTRLTNDIGLTAFPALSPGGDLLVYASDRSGRGDLDLWIQPRGGGEPRRMTDDPADDYAPNFSPDGSTIAFRSERDGGGIYVVPAMGGETRLLAKSGHHPRYSPDGDWIAYSVSSTRLFPSAAGSGHMFVISSRGGTPRPIRPEFSSAHHPLWSPDGRHLLFAGLHSGWIKDGPEPRADLWVTPLEGGEAVKTGVFPALNRLRLRRPHWPRLPWTPWAWTGDSLLTSQSLKDAVDLWRLPISPHSFQVTGPPERLTFGSGSEVSAGELPSGDIVFADTHQNDEIWSLPVDADRGRVTGPMERLTQNEAVDIWPSVSRDGRTLVYESTRTGRPAVWQRDLETGRELQLTNDGEGGWPEITPDGRAFLYMRFLPSIQQLAVWRAKPGDSPTQFCTDCEALSQLPDGSGFVYSTFSRPSQLRLIGLNGETAPWLQHTQWHLRQPQASPDGQWIAFYAALAPELSRIYVAPFRRDTAPEQSEWIAITEGLFLETVPLWSPDGNRIYFASNRDSYQCIWSIALDQRSKRPITPPATLAHFHKAALPMGNPGMSRRGMSVARGRIVFPLQEQSGNIWVLHQR